MYSEFYSSPFYQLDQSLYLPNYCSSSEYGNDNGQRGIYNNTTIFENYGQRYYYNDSGNKNEEKENSTIKLDLNKDQEEDNFNDSAFKLPADENQYKNLLEKKIPDLGNLNTKATSFIGKKTKKSNKSEFTYFSEKVNDGKTKCGRKKKDSIIKGNHNKNTEDNIMRKIKTNFFKYINQQLNEKLKNKNYQFLKLDSKINENLKKDYNINLMQKKIKDIYFKSEISSKYRSKKKNSSDTNIRIIEEIYNEMEEKEVVNILESTYLDLFEEFRMNYLSQMLNHIREEEVKKDESEKDIYEYLEKIKNLCVTYEEWFKNKKGRNRTKNRE